VPHHRSDALKIRCSSNRSGSDDTTTTNRTAKTGTSLRLASSSDTVVRRAADPPRRVYASPPSDRIPDTHTTHSRLASAVERGKLRLHSLAQTEDKPTQQRRLPDRRTNDRPTDGDVQGDGCCRTTSWRPACNSVASPDCTRRPDDDNDDDGARLPTDQRPLSPRRLTRDHTDQLADQRND